MRSNETNYYMQTYLHLLTSLKRFGWYMQTVRYTLRERKFQGTKIPRSESSIELSFPGAKRPRSERARERKGQGVKVPGSELARVLLADSLRGANWPGSEKARYLHNGTYLTLSLTLIIMLTLLTPILDTIVNKAPTSQG